MVKKTLAMALAISFASLLAMVPNAHAKDGADNPPEKVEQENVG